MTATTEQLIAARDEAFAVCQRAQVSKELTITAAIVNVRRRTDCTVEEAIDTVLGAGAYSRIAGDLYDALRA